VKNFKTEQVGERMSYLEEIKGKLQAEDYQGFLTLWEEYCAGDEVDGVELRGVLKLILESRFALRFGAIVETALPLWEGIEDKALKYAVLQLIIDLETTQSPELAELAYQALEERYDSHAHFQDKIRLVGLRNRHSFTGAIQYFELLNHLDEGRFVYHIGGWGTGEILELSLVREEIKLEFEAVPGKKVLSFDNAFKNLLPLPDNHFLARRFGDPDLLEEQARKDPLEVIQILLRDLGPKTAAEIKEELCDWVIPEGDWPKWWQSARGRIKRDTMIDTPRSLREPFRLHQEEVSHVQRLQEALAGKSDAGEILVTTYSFVRDFPEVSKSAEGQGAVRHKLTELLDREQLTPAQKLEAYAILEDLLGKEAGVSFNDAVKEVGNFLGVINEMEIIALKKRALLALQKSQADWPALFLEFLFVVQQSTLREFLLKELMSQENRSRLEERLVALRHQPAKQPYLFLWYFQKVVRGDSDVLFQGKEMQCHYFEAFLILLHQLELLPSYRELVKKMYGLVTAGRFALVREVLEGSSLEFAKEFLLLVSKSHTFTPHDIKILHALAEVAHPILLRERRESGLEQPEEVLWMTEQGYQKLRDRLEEINRSVADNAKEIDAAREHGDLRENAEFKAAKERQSRLQAELKMVADQVNGARILTQPDVVTDKIGVGTVVALIDEKGEHQNYTLLGPPDADPDRHILAVQSRFAQAMTGLKQGETFTYQGQTYTVGGISNFFEVR
jgi:transcription elongation factor GreA-like protein/transcription elongation GreA/GreB family factor